MTIYDCHPTTPISYSELQSDSSIETYAQHPYLQLTIVLQPLHKLENMACYLNGTMHTL